MKTGFILKTGVDFRYKGSKKGQSAFHIFSIIITFFIMIQTHCGDLKKATKKTLKFNNISLLF